MVLNDHDDDDKGNEIFNAPDEENVDPQMGLEVSLHQIIMKLASEFHYEVNLRFAYYSYSFFMRYLYKFKCSTRISRSITDVLKRPW